MTFHSEAVVPAPLSEVFAFFGAAENLERLTPPWLNFHIVTPRPIVMRPGTLIDYRLRIHGVPVRWRSEITIWEPPFRFVDEQRRGPCRSWVHAHAFREENGQTIVKDDVAFEVPLAFLAGWFVRRDVEKIFAYRMSVLAGIFRSPGPL